MKGDSLSIHDLAKMNEYVVLDFWGTWCAPCINEMPQLGDLYEKYRGRIEIVGITYNDSESKWRRKIKSDGLNWIQVLNVERNNIVDLYGVQKFPSKIVINKDSKILFTDLQLNEGMNFYDFVKDLLEK